ncbi:PEP-CTERM sorting domain-containing protein [Omnitrophica bacterium]|nr:PEP-CTERM sorting domain-containing protein [Candidatus Omnitrophota bacterium]
MKLRLAMIVLCMVSVFALAGCKGGGGGGGSYAGGGSSIGGDTSTGTTSTVGGTLPTAHQPEPATIALLGGGLAAYALLRRRKRK